MDGTLAELFVILNLKDNMTGALSGAGTGLQGFTTAASSAAIAGGQLASKASSVVDSYNTLSSAAATLSIQTGLPKEALEGLIKSLYSADTPMNEVTGTLNTLGEAGVKNASDLKTIADSFDILADGTGNATDVITSQLVPAFKAFNIPLQEAPQYIDALAVTFKETGVSSSEFATVMTRLGPKLSESGIGMTDVATALGALKENGVQGRLAISTLNNVLEEGVDANKDGKISTEELSAAIGVSVEQWDKANKKVVEGAGKAQEYADAANIATPAGSGFAVAMDKLGQDVGKVISPLGDVVGGLGGFGSTVSEIGSSILILQAIGPSLTAMTGGGIISGLSALAAGFAATGASLMAALIPALIAAAPIIIGIGIALAVIWALNELGVFQWIIDQGAAFGEWISNFDIGAAFQGVIDFIKGIPEMIMKALGTDGGKIASDIVSIIFPAKLILDLLNKFFPQVGQWFSDIGTKIIDFLKGIDPNTVVSAILAIIFPPTLILTALGVNWTDVGKWFADIGKLVIESVGKIVVDFAKFASALLPVDKIVSALGAAWNTIGQWFSDLGKLVTDFIKEIDPSIIVGAIFPISLIVTALGAAWETVGKWFSDIGKLVIEAIGKIVDLAKDIASALFPTDDIVTALGGAIKGVVDFFQGIWDKYFQPFWDGFSSSITGIIDTVSEYLSNFSTAWEDLVNTFQSVWDGVFKPIWDEISEVVSEAVDTIKGLLDDLGSKWNETVSFFKNLWDNTFKPLWYTIAEVIDTVLTGIKDGLGLAGEKWDEIVSVFKSIWDNTFKPLWDTIKGVIDDVIKAVIGFIEDLGDTWDRIVHDIKSVWDTVFKVVWDTLKSVADTVITSVKGFITDLGNKWEEIVLLIKDIWEKDFKPVFTSLYDTAFDVINAVKRFFEELGAKWNETVSFFKNLWDNTFKPLWYTIAEVIDTVIGEVTTTLDKFLTLLKDVWKWVTDVLDKIKEFLGLNPKKSLSASITSEELSSSSLSVVHEVANTTPASQKSVGISGGTTIINNYDKLVLPNVTNYEEFKKALGRDQRRIMSYSGVI